jgi:hypothetical protein
MSGSNRFGTKPMRELRRRFRPGYSVTQNRSGHFMVVGPDSEPVRDVSGRPFTLPGSPTFNAHALKRMESALRKAKVIE